MAAQTVRSPVAGTVWKIEVDEGASVSSGTLLMILESMKMEIPIEAPGEGPVALKVAEGDQIGEDQELATIG